jgi:hypothetical protein
MCRGRISGLPVDPKRVERSAEALGAEMAGDDAHALLPFVDPTA